MIHYYNYRPEAGDEQSSSERETHVVRRRHPLRKALKAAFFLFLFLLLAIAIFAGVLYFYVANTAVASTDGRTNIAVLGVDEVASLSDTIMIISILDEGNAPDVVMMSVPRDMYVDVPGFGPSKINAAYAYGENNDYPGGGPGLTVATLEEVLQQDIHYYAALDFDGFEELVDAAGGVEVEVPAEIHDPFYPSPDGSGHEPFSIREGTQELDGEMALKYARSRQTTTDFDRAFRQQQIVLALHDEVSAVDSWSRVQVIARLLETLDEHTITNMSRVEMLQLAALLRSLSPDEVPQYVLDTTNFLTSSQVDGSSLVPHTGSYSEIQTFFDNIFVESEIEEYESLF